tara:strand:- start:144 stop:413 length:270 start_codon:yes stop_codon:yes gene_type:complete
MSSWSNADNAASAPLWAGNQLGLAPSSANRTDLFEDATADNFITGMTIGLFNYASGEVPSGAAHMGWNLKFIKGSRTRYECLVALANPA